MDLNPTYSCAFTQTIDKISYLTIVFTNTNTLLSLTRQKEVILSHMTLVLDKYY
jgi:hypothetical protein